MNDRVKAEFMEVAGVRAISRLRQQSNRWLARGLDVPVGDEAVQACGTPVFVAADQVDLLRAECRRLRLGVTDLAQSVPGLRSHAQVDEAAMTELLAAKGDFVLVKLEVWQHALGRIMKADPTRWLPQRLESVYIRLDSQRGRHNISDLVL